MTFCLRSPSICHSDSDLSEGSRKYSPSSETSLETQRACGKAEERHFAHVHTHPDTYASQILCVISFIKPSHRNRIIHLDKHGLSLLFFHFCHCRRKQLLSSICSLFLSLVLCLPPARLSQEASQRRTPLSATIMASAARRKCSG